MKKKNKMILTIIIALFVCIPVTVYAATYITADQYNSNPGIADQTVGTYTPANDGETEVWIEYNPTTIADPLAEYERIKAENKEFYNDANLPEAPQDPEPEPQPEPQPVPQPQPTPQPEPEPQPQQPSQPSQSSQRANIEAFVSRMYTVALGREAEYEGLMFWSDGLERHEYDGASIARGFMCSKEFQQKGYSNEQYVATLYRTFFNREADPGGWENWNRVLAQGYSRNYVLSGFVNSKEFAILCDQYNIARGTMEQDGSNIYNVGVRNFVLRNYTKALGRNGETEGVEFWCHLINTKQKSALDVAQSFFHSKEFLQKNLSNEQFVEVCYQTFLDRSSDSSGKAYWLQELSKGKSRDEIMHGFAYSKEFGQIMARYGVQ